MKYGSQNVGSIHSFFDSNNRRNRFRAGLEKSIRKFYAQGYSKDTLCLAMGISKEELSRIISSAANAKEHRSER